LLAAAAGDRFTATVAEPVQLEVIAKGAAVTGAVTDAKACGKIKGGCHPALSARAHTGNKNIVLLAETMLSFKLVSPV